jgi:ABC-type phosphate transport system substrate-binding protein
VRVNRAWTALLPVVFVGALFFSSSRDRSGTPIAVIVHEQVSVDDLSLPELRRIFLGERQSWSRELTVTLLLPPRGTPERKVLLAKIYQRRSEVQVQHYWINRMFGNEMQAGPKITGSNEMSATLVREIPGAIALVPANRIPQGVKVLRIDGKKPGQGGYPLVAPG